LTLLVKKLHQSEEKVRRLETANESQKQRAERFRAKTEASIKAKEVLSNEVLCLKKAAKTASIRIRDLMETESDLLKKSDRADADKRVVDGHLMAVTARLDCFESAVQAPKSSEDASSSSDQAKKDIRLAEAESKVHTGNLIV
jgi:hypothetical protein